MRSPGGSTAILDSRTFEREARQKDVSRSSVPEAI
jgi:hypothetical protein